MDFQISEQERQLLQRILEGSLAELRPEVRRTETRDYREKLKAEEASLRDLIARLKA